MTYTIHRYPAELIDVVRSRSGVRITLRPVLPQDEDAIADFYRKLSDVSRRTRFFRSLRELPPALQHSFTNVDYHAHLALVATIHVGSGEEIIGDGRYVVVAPSKAEFAVTVADKWQRHGIATLLLERLLHRGKQDGLSCLFGDLLPGNNAMRQLARAFGMSVAPTGDGVGLLRAKISVRAPHSTPTQLGATARHLGVGRGEPQQEVSS